MNVATVPVAKGRFEPTVEVDQPGFGQYFKDYGAQLRSGNTGSLPALAGLLVAGTFFAVMNPAFLTAMNFANLFTQGAQVTAIAMGMVFVLLLGELDLSAGYTSGVCAAVLGVALTDGGWPWYLAIGAAIVTGMGIGLVLGLLVAKVGIPSFVVTLAAFLACQGVVLLMLGNGSLTITSNAIKAIDATGRLSPLQGWILAAVTVAGYGAVQVVRRARRLANELVAEPLAVVLLRIAGLAALLGTAVYVLNLERSLDIQISSQRGVPLIVVLLGALLVLWTVVLKCTVYGRHLYAVGGNREAARRAGIKVDAIRVSVFVICSGMAAIGGIVAASRVNSVESNIGGSNVLLYAVGAAVIGGTSLFGGKGRVIDAVLGGTLIAVIDNGMGLMGYSSGQRYLINGAVLLSAAGIDALSRRRAKSNGLR